MIKIELTPIEIDTLERAVEHFIGIREDALTILPKDSPNSREHCIDTINNARTILKKIDTASKS